MTENLVARLLASSAGLPESLCTFTAGCGYTPAVMRSAFRGFKAAILLSAAVAAAFVGCEADDGLRLPSRESAEINLADFTLIARIIHISDSQLIDEESPARFAGAQELVRSAWRPYEAYSTQLLDGTLRAANRIHASGRAADCLVLTGDTCDNAQTNELRWLLDVFDGRTIDPRSGPDDRAVETLPDPLMDPHASFSAQGLYRTGSHGDMPSIPWYAVFGNHDRFGIGVFAVFENLFGRRVAELPFARRPGVFLPTVFDPVGAWTHGKVTPAEPGPPAFLELPAYVEPNPDRKYFNQREFIRAMFMTESGPAGHGFADPETGPSWYSVSPVEGLRLIGLNTCEPAHQIAGFPYQDGSISAEQVAFLRDELPAAEKRGELVVVASHHPSGSLWAGYGSALIGSEFRALLSEYPHVVAHLAGHTHRNRVTARDTYLEIETCSTLDLPQEGRIVEIWRRNADGLVAIKYEMFSHLDEQLPVLGIDPLRAMRAAAQAIAQADQGGAARQKRLDPTGVNPYGSAVDRSGMVLLQRGP